MATQIIALQAPAGLDTPTLRVFPDGSDTAVSGSPFTLTEATNRKGHYQASFTGTLSGLHEVVLYSGANPVGAGWVMMTNASGTYIVQGDRDTARGATALLTIQAQTASSTVAPVLPLATEGEPLSVLRGNNYSLDTLQPITFTADDFGTPDSVAFLVSVDGVNVLSIDCTVTTIDIDTFSVSVPELTPEQIDDLPSGALSDYQFLAKYATTKPRSIRWGKMSVTDVAVAPAAP